ncbi:hypothetical protein TrVE_jg9308 [Triparma verrucosa]|uniref:Uncharacterized protein n=1 Tax=Triparma verrucosa TaxID=1606542 RepID=A0A9W7CIA1_9STRA|nr:hypothetical protein TrVE_jg9308 [Triparma verrucosa]
MIEFFGFCTCAGCGLFLISLYGADGDFGSEFEASLVISIMSLGGVSLSVVAIWKGLAIRKESREEKESQRSSMAAVTPTPPQSPAAVPPPTLLKRGSRFWFWLGVLATSIQSATFLASAITLEPFWITISATILPIVAVCYLGSFFCDPRAQDKKTISSLVIHFVSFSIVGQGSWLVYELRNGEVGFAFSHVLRAVLEVLFFRVGLKIRRDIGQLPPDQLHKFLVDALYRGGISTIASVLFITFRATKCIFEHNLEKCTNTATCSSFISLFIILKWWITLVRFSLPSNLLQEVVHPVSHLVTLNVKFMESVQLVCLSITGGCGIYLFAMMDSLKTTADTVLSVGTIGCACIATAVVLEARRIRLIQIRHRSDPNPAPNASTTTEQPVTEGSWIYIIISSLITLAAVILNVLYAVTLRRYWQYSQMLTPLAGMGFILSIFWQPRNKLALKLLWVQSFFLIVMREGAFAVGLYRRGLIGFVIEAVVRSIVIFFLFYKGLGLRETLGKISDEKLGEYICETLFKTGYKVIIPLIFFAFETVSCMTTATADELDENFCTNTSAATAGLSNYLAIFTLQRLVNILHAKIYNYDAEVTYDEIATLNLNWPRKVQGVMVVIMSICSMYLFSFVGVSSHFNDWIYRVGNLGFLCICISLTMEIWMLRNFRKYNIIKERSGVGRKVEEDKISDGMIVGALV